MLTSIVGFVAFDIAASQ